jgi:hypothetical protein
MKNAVLALVSIALTTPAFAQVKAAESDKAESIVHLMKLIGIDKLQQSMINQMLAALKPTLPKPPVDDLRLKG